MKRLATWLKNWELKLSMAEKELSRSLKRLTNTRPELLNSLARCLQLSPNYPCSNQRLWSFSKKKKRKNLLLKSQWEEWILVYHQLILASKNGIRWSVIDRERLMTKTREPKENFSNNNYHQLVSRLLLFQDLILICLQIFVTFIFLIYVFILEIPKPYGSFAPFMPSEPGSSMRHMIKPKIREIEYWATLHKN